jgi:hypothetical protein
MHPRTLARSLAPCALFACVACDFADCGGLDEPPAGLAPGAELDSDVVTIADSLTGAAERPAELLRPHLQNALVDIGFGVRVVDDFIIVDEEDPQGIVFEPWDIDTIAVGLHQGLAITLDDYAGVWADLVPGTDAAAIKAALLADLAVAAGSDVPARRAYAQLLVALGRTSAVRYDLLDPAVDGASPLDALQLSLLTFRLSAELWQSVRNEDGSQKTQGLDGPAPCTQTDTEGLVMDGSAVVSSSVWGGILGHLSDKGSAAADKFSLTTQVANAALVYVKLAWTMAVFRVDMDVDPQPLERTLSTSTAGADATVTATFRLDGTGKAQILNCMRIALNAMNIDFSVPQDGPLAGKRVEWSVVARGKDDVIQTASGDILRKETSAAGVSEIVVQGRPQERSLEGKKTVEVQRRPKVHASVNLKNKDFAQDMIDVSAGVGGLGALWSMPAEILNRKPLLFNGVVTVEVNDHKELIGDHFQIVGDYTNPSGVGTTFAKEVTDHFVANIEVTIADGVLTAEILGWSDSPARYTDDYEPEFTDGEDCVATMTVDGNEEVFSSLHKEVAEGFYVPPGTPGQQEMAWVSLAATGYSSQRGYHVNNEEPSCPDRDVAPTAGETLLFVQFDSTMFSGLGSSVVIDSRDGSSTGWVYTVTYVE